MAGHYRFDIGILKGGKQHSTVIGKTPIIKNWEKAVNACIDGLDRLSCVSSNFDYYAVLYDRKDNIVYQKTKRKEEKKCLR